MSSRSAVEEVRASSRSRVPSAERQSEENRFAEESSEKVEECFPGMLSDENQPVENQNNEVIVTMEDESKSVDQTNSTDDNQLSYNFPEERGESIIADSMTPCHADDGDTEESAHITTLDAAPTSPSPPKASLSGFMDGFRNFSRITEQFFCKTEEYLGDFAMICGGEATSATMEANISRQEKGVVDFPVAPTKDEPTMNSVEVSPIFDEPEPLVVQPVDGISSFDGDSRPSAEEEMPLPTEIEPILASVDPANSIELGQSSSLRSTKSNKSLTLLTEVETKPSTESEKVTAAEPSEHLPVDSVDGASVSAALASCEEERRQSEMKCNEKESSLVSTEVIHENITSETPVESLKGHGGRKNFKIRKSFFKKPGLGRVDDSTHDNEDINEPQAHFSVMKSLKTGLKQLSPRANGGYKGLSKPKGTDSVDECVSSDVNRSSTQKPTDLYHDEGVRVYGGGVTVAINEPTQYPKHPLNYGRKKSGIRRHVDHMRETAKNMNKVLQKRIVTASQPRMKAIMTNHVYHKDQASNRLH
ncbi:hypothetical protein HJC23_003390 [Cyclotella cryptica]|uniref:Uncharacterized protein n=1 Tax=Cyclotella cryptica TaxID=29204 RepID=A0ABD3NTU5_9STRA|eukprot:CCRYP_019853-RA/>CCRYP_019853-RA protein AED:0.43 eAED:0.43 QI:0/-1/0/1/-1/1/1/0/531